MVAPREARLEGATNLRRHVFPLRLGREIATLETAKRTGSVPVDTRECDVFEVAFHRCPRAFGIARVGDGFITLVRILGRSRIEAMVNCRTPACDRHFDAIDPETRHTCDALGEVWHADSCRLKVVMSEQENTRRDASDRVGALLFARLLGREATLRRLT